MQNEELVSQIEEYLKKGGKIEEIRDSLLEQGMDGNVLDELLASVHKPPSFWQQLPTYKYFEAWDKKTAELPARKIWAISGVMVLSVILIGIMAYRVIDPQGLRGEERDKMRGEAQAKLSVVLRDFWLKNGHYPASLGELVPAYINSIPVDPKTGLAYEYVSSGNGRTYNLCVIFETKAVSSGCFVFETIRPGR